MTTLTETPLATDAEVGSGFESLLLQLVGEPFLFLRRSYGDELVLFFGARLLGPVRKAGAREFRYEHATHSLHLRGSVWLIKSGTAPVTFTGGLEANFEQLLGKPTRRANVEQEHPFVAGTRVTAVAPFLVHQPDVAGIGLRVTLADGSSVIVIPSPTEPETGADVPPEANPFEVADWELKTPRGRLEVGPGRKWHVAPLEFEIRFVGVPEHLIKAADEILATTIHVSRSLKNKIRGVAKAYRRGG